MKRPLRALHEEESCPSCGARLEVIETRPLEGAVTINGEERFPALYRCGGATVHCWVDVPVAGAAASGARFELRSRRCPPSPGA